jgi:toxin ParE1/3/4
MASYIFTEQAEQDLAAIIDFTQERWGKAQANNYLDSLHTKVQTLADNPELGLPREALAADLLSFPHQSHIIFYLPQPYGITIVRVLHASMDTLKQFT